MADSFCRAWEEQLREICVLAGVPNARVQGVGHEELEQVPLPVFVLEVPDLMRVPEWFSDADDSPEILEDEGFRFVVFPLELQIGAERRIDSVVAELGSTALEATPSVGSSGECGEIELEQKNLYFLIVVERPAGENATWDSKEFLELVDYSAEEAFRGIKVISKVLPLSRSAALFVQLLDRVAPDLRRHQRAGELLVQLHDHASELALKNIEILEKLQSLRSLVRDSELVSALSREDLFSVNRIRDASQVSKMRLKNVTDFTQRQIESRGLHADLGLNRAMLWLTVVTLGFGLLTIFDKYQSDRTFGIDAPTGLSRTGAAILGLSLVSIFSFRRQIRDFVQSLRIWNWLHERTLRWDFNPPDRLGFKIVWWRWPAHKVRALWREIQLSGAWWASTESLQRIHTQCVPMGEQGYRLRASGTEAIKSRGNSVDPMEVDKIVKNEIDTLHCSLSRLEWAFSATQYEPAFSSYERVRQVEAIVWYLLRVSSTALEWERPLFPIHEVAYWLVAKEHLVEIGNYLKFDCGVEEELSETMPPWGDALGLSSLIAQTIGMPASEVSWLVERLDAAAKRMLDGNSQNFQSAGALYCLLNPKNDDEKISFSERCSVADWYMAAEAEGLTTENLCARWAEAQRREDEAEARG